MKDPSVVLFQRPPDLQESQQIQRGHPEPGAQIRPNPAQHSSWHQDAKEGRQESHHAGVDCSWWQVLPCFWSMQPSFRPRRAPAPGPHPQGSTVIRAHIPGRPLSLSSTTSDRGVGQARVGEEPLEDAPPAVMMSNAPPYCSSSSGGRKGMSALFSQAPSITALGGALLGKGVG